jgi:protein-S-isoprenylcysteine O-methyltransferase Ste14
MKIDITYMWLIGAWAIYFSLHSLMARQNVKQWAAINLSLNKYYRLVYSMISTIGLFALLVFNGLYDQTLIISRTKVIMYLSLMLATSGVLIISRSFKVYSLKKFLGLSKKEESELQIKGILKYVRHPIYCGTILIIIGYWFFNPTIATTVTCITTFLYLPIGILLEEKSLIREFGETYLNYKRKVPALIPKLCSSSSV